MILSAKGGNGQDGGIGEEGRPGGDGRPGANATRDTNGSVSFPEHYAGNTYPLPLHILTIFLGWW